MEYSNLTWEIFKNTLSKLDAAKADNKFTVITGLKGAALFDLAVSNYASPMPEDLYNLKWEAIQCNAYIHPGWDYLRYPSANLDYGYPKQESNLIYEEELDDYGYPVYVCVGRCSQI